MNAAHLKSRLPQQGMVTAMAVIFLIAVVIFALSQTLSITGSNSIDNKQQMDSVAALFLAESGLERAMGIVSSAANSGTMNGGVCSVAPSPPALANIATGGPFTLGRGNFTYVSAVPSPDSGCVGTNCTGCSVQVTGNVGSSSRTLNLDINLTAVNGTSGFGTKVTMPLKNTYSVPATAVFNLAWRRQGGTTGEVVAGGNANATASAGCTLRWNDESSSGSPSGGSMGASCDIAASPATATVTQTISTDRNYAEVGALFPGISATPNIIGSNWNDASGGNGTKTVNNSSATPSQGQTNSGVATTSSDTCTVPNPNATNTSQSCTSWCNGGDTLIFGVSARSSSFADEITGVAFNTNGNPSQNIPMTRVAHFPNTSGQPPSTGDIYSEIWYAYNPNYSATGAASGGVATGSIGVSSFNATLTSGSNLMTVNSLSGFLHVGDTVTCTAGGPCPGFLPATITAVPGGGVISGATGNYTLSSSSTNNTTRDFRTSSSYLDVSAVSSNYLSLGDTVSGTGVTAATITSVGGGGSASNAAGPYGISIPQLVASTTISSSGTTIFVPGGTAIPVVDTVVSVFSGTGAFAANTTVLPTPGPIPNSFMVSAAPTTRVSAATICGGICAFFDDPASTSSTTQFTVTRTAGTNQWAGGFTCLSGVDKDKIRAVTSSLSSASTWREVVQ